MARSPKYQEKLDQEAEVMDFLRERALDFQDRNDIRRNRAVTNNFARDEFFLQQLGASLESIFTSKKVTAPKFVSRKKKVTERVLNLLWSDLHFGSLMDNREVPLRYGPVEEARRLAAICTQAADYKRHYRDETDLVVNLAGDIIEGVLHDLREGAPLAEQVAVSIHLLLQALLFLAGEFKKVTVRCATGNHGRNKARHAQRATSQKWDSIETMIYYSLKVALRDVPNVTVELDYRPYYVYENFGMKTFVTHGDTVFNAGYPGNSVNVANIRKQINEFNAALNHDDKVTLFCVGHVHVGSVVHLPNGTIFLSNGALVPVGPYAQSIGNHDTASGQWLWESVPGHLLGDQRFLVVDERTDRDEALDKIIRPFEGF